MRRRDQRDEDFTAFVAARSARLVQIAWMLCGDRDLAEDLVQTTLEKAYQRWDRIEMGDPFGYVRQALVNHYLSWTRRRLWHERPSGGPAEIDILDATALRLPGRDQATCVDERVVLDQALSTLTTRERSVLVLRFLEDLTEAQTADALRVAKGTVKSTQARALGKMRDALATNLSYRGAPA